ncbi:MAG: hypothetical protein H6615_10220 [Ignavibacteria bacterium]|nr:hypothetical protein [Ignavibacteria bacterium]
MRKYLILFVMLFSIATYLEVVAQVPCVCSHPFGNATVTETISDGVNSCQVTVNYCRWYDKYANVLYIKLCSISLPIGCSLNLDLSDGSFWDKIFNITIENDWRFNNIPDCDLSGNGSILFEITKAQCWILENDPIQQMYVFTPCVDETATCMTKFTVCINTNGELIIEEQHTNILGTSNCTYEGSTILNPETFPFDECFDTCY